MDDKVKQMRKQVYFHVYIAKNERVPTMLNRVVNSKMTEELELIPNLYTSVVSPPLLRSVNGQSILP